MNSTYWFPITMILLNWGASIVFFWQGEPRWGLYWILASGLTILVTFK